MSSPFPKDKMDWIVWGCVGFISVCVLICFVLTTSGAKKEPPKVIYLELELEECQTKLENTEDFNELSLIECVREIEYWKERREKEVTSCQNALKIEVERATGAGCWAELDRFKHAYYWERADCVKYRRAHEEADGAAQSD